MARRRSRLEPARDPVAVALDALERAVAAAPGMDLSWIAPPPPPGGWALAPDALRFLSALASVMRPRHVVEFGSGLSTRVIARAVADSMPACRVSSIDNDPFYSHEAETALGPCRVHVRFQAAPLVMRDFGGKLVVVYDFSPARLASRRPADLVLVDGPALELGGREGVLYQSLSYTRPGTIVLLDDAARREEQAVLGRWRDNLGEAIEVSMLPGFRRGLAAIVVRRPLDRASLIEHRLDLLLRDLERAVPDGETFILFDERWWEEKLARGRRRALPFLDRDGGGSGAPADDRGAIDGVERLLGAGARYALFAWPAFWWLDFYSGLREWLETRGRAVVENDRLVLFELRQE